MSPQLALRGGTTGAEEHNLRSYTRAVGDDAYPALRQCIRQIQSGKSIFSIRRPSNGDSVWEGHRSLDLHLSRLRNEAEIGLSR